MQWPTAFYSNIYTFYFLPIFQMTEFILKPNDNIEFASNHIVKTFALVVSIYY